MTAALEPAEQRATIEALTEVIIRVARWASLRL
jgi:hypothetical protein